MELIEIKSVVDMDCGSPSPIILSNDTELYIVFYSDKKNILNQVSTTKSNTGIYVLKFKGYLKYLFGLPGDETIKGHPYSKFGMKPYSFYELKNSDFIKKLKDIQKIHPEYNPEIWNKYKHYILTFHDNMFECIAKDFEIREKDTSLYNQVSNLINGVTVKHF